MCGSRGLQSSESYPVSFPQGRGGHPGRGGSLAGRRCLSIHPSVPSRAVLPCPSLPSRARAAAGPFGRCLSIHPCLPSRARADVGPYGRRLSIRPSLPSQPALMRAPSLPAPACAAQVVLGDGERMSYGVCVWSTGNSARPLVRSIVQQLKQQAEHQGGRGPNAAKLAVDPYLRIIGARDAIALGDNSSMVGDRLPATAQVGIRSKIPIWI
jgi:hypothetical protein